MSAFANGAKAAALCDRCGQRYRLGKLKGLTIKGKLTNIMVCPDCWEPDHPQLKLGSKPIHDPQALRNPRPDTGIEESRRIIGSWNPIGGGNSLSGTPNPLESASSLGTVTVTTE